MFPSVSVVNPFEVSIQYLGRLKLIVCFASKYFQNPMREGENPAQTPEKSTGLFHSHLALIQS